MPEPDEDELARFGRFVGRWLKANITPYEGTRDPVALFEWWLDQTDYTEDRKDQLRTIAEKQHYGPPSRKVASKVKSFIKLESYDEPKEARWINSRIDEFKAFAGPYFKIVENILFARPEFIKHIPVPDRPALISAMKKAGLRYFSTDFTAYESHFTPKFMWLCECQLYLHVLGDNAISRFMCDVITGENNLRTRSGLKFKVNGRRMSGDMCTSLGNGFSNLMLALYVAYRISGDIDPELHGFQAFVEGDDGLFACPYELEMSWYTKLGFTIKMDEVSSPEEASFCGLLCSPDGAVIKDPRRVFRTFGWTSSFINAGPQIMDSLLKSKALSLCYELPQCPILGQLGRSALSAVENIELTHRHDTYRKVPLSFKVEPFNPSPMTRLFFEAQFGITPQQQIAAEEAIRHGDNARVSEIVRPTSSDWWYSTRYLEVG